MEDRSFYVYAHYRLDTMEPFYIGKGKGKRKDALSRNPIHDNISKKYGHAVVILYDNLTEEEAFFYEREIIEDLVFNEGYEIPCKNCGEFTKEFSYLTNFSFGGEGTSGYNYSEESKKRISIATKNRYKDPEARKKTGEAAKIALNKPEVKEKLSKSIKIALNKPEVKEKLSKIQRKRYEDEKEREKQSKAQRKRYEDEKEREKTSIAIKKHYEDPKEREKQSKAIKTSWENPERKKIQSEKLSGENNGTSKYHKVIINNKTIIGRYIDETINISKQYIDNINRNWFKKSKGIPNKFKNIVSIEEISREDYYMLLQSKNIISYVNVCK